MLTFAVFSKVCGNEFVDFDDLGYIANNHILRRLDLQTLLWALFESTEANWHPLTLLSLAIEHQLWGLTADGVHLTNVVIHCGTVFFSFYLFRDLLCKIPGQHACITASLPRERHSPLDREQAPALLLIGCSLAAAMFFGIHPLRVESVVWASERKDVLCLFFMVNALRLYLLYCQQGAYQPERPFWQSGLYWLTLLFACLAQLSKPVAVSLPFILMILDRYPLERPVAGKAGLIRMAEKVPFLLVAACGAVLTMIAQRAAMARAPEVDFLSRILVACKALLFYPVKSVWPADLSPFYIHPGKVAASFAPEYLLFAAVVGSLSLIAVAAGRRYPSWRAFWLIHVVTLAPMLGLVQVGGQWVADRYSYLPSLGISLLWGGCLQWLLLRLLHTGRVAAAACCVPLVLGQLSLYALLTLRQIPVWHTTESLMTRIIELAERQSWSSYYTRARYRHVTGRFDQALEDIDQALLLATRDRLLDRYTEIAIARADVLNRLGRLPEAVAAAEWAIEKSVGPPPVRNTRFLQELKLMQAAE